MCPFRCDICSAHVYVTCTNVTTNRPLNVCLHPTTCHFKTSVQSLAYAHKPNRELPTHFAAATMNKHIPHIKSSSNQKGFKSTDY